MSSEDSLLDILSTSSGVCCKLETLVELGSGTYGSLAMISWSCFNLVNVSRYRTLFQTLVTKCHYDNTSCSYLNLLLVSSNFGIECLGTW